MNRDIRGRDLWWRSREGPRQRGREEGVKTVVEKGASERVMAKRCQKAMQELEERAGTLRIRGRIHRAERLSGATRQQYRSRTLVGAGQKQGIKRKDTSPDARDQQKLGSGSLWLGDASGRN